MSPSIFSRLSQSGAEQDSAPPVEQTPADQPRPFRAVVDDWRTQLADTMRQELASNPLTRLDLGHPHPGGLAQLYAEHPTKLSNLFRDSDQQRVSEAAALDVLRQAQRMIDDHGSVTLYLSIGTARWLEDDARRTTPILLRPIDMTMGEDSEIYLALRPGIEISNRLLMVLSRYGQPIETADLLNLVRTRHGFSPEAALQLVREAGGAVPGFELEDTLSVGVFSHPTSALLRELGAPQWLSLSAPVRALAGDAQARGELDFEPAPPNPGDRDPWAERGLGEQPPQLADVIEAATGPNSVLVEAPAGEDYSHTVAAIAAEHAAQGRSVLVVAAQGAAQQAVADALTREGVAGVANLIGGTARSAETVQQHLQSAFLDASDDFDKDAIDEMRTRLRRRREELSSYTESLHQEFPEWGVSAFDALQVLTDLTSIPGGPTTRVRLSRASLEALAADQGQAARELLQQASSLGMFSGDVLRNWWTGVELLDDPSVEQALHAVRELSERVLPQTERDMQAVSAKTGLRLAANVRDWEAELDLLRGVRQSLDVFVPRVFERSAADMVLATASKEWRRDRGINLRGSQRRRLVKQAKDLLVPGAHVPDLHRELVSVQERRDQWRKLAAPETWPTVPADITAVLATFELLMQSLHLLNRYLEPVYGNLYELSMEELGGLMDALAADPAGARELPERVRIASRLEAMGLGELMADLQERRVDGEALSLEVDLAWWATALSMMLSQDPRLGGFDPSQLQDALGELRDLEGQQAASLGPQARSRIMRLRQQALAEIGSNYEQTQRELAVPMAAAAYYARQPISWRLMPIVITAPALVPQVVPWGRHVDVVLLAGLDEVSLPALIPVLARGRQVIAVGPGGPQQENFAELARALPKVTMTPQPQRVNDAIVGLLSRYDVGSAGISIPSRRTQGRLDLQLVDGTGMPAPGLHAIESSAAEVEAVVQRVREHAHHQADVSLAVVALNDRHAERIEAALRTAVATDTTLRGFVRAGRTEPFVVIGPEAAHGLRRDRVIVAVGYAKTPHGRVIHDFGPYSQPGGEHLLAQVLRTARGDLDLIAAFDPAEVDTERLRQPGAHMLVDLLKLGSTVQAESETPWPTLEVAPDHLLVDLAERLYGLGLNVVPNLGVPGGLRIPLGIGHPEVPGELLVAVLTDDDDYISEPSLRVRDRLIPELLEEQGWKVRIELSMAVFIDPNKEAEAIVQLVLDAVDEFYDRHPELRPEPTLIEVEAGPATAAELDLLDEEPNPMGEDRSATEDEEATEAEQDEPPTQEESLFELEDTAAHLREIKAREGRPSIAPGLPLAAYGDDQLDEVAQWIIQGAPELGGDELVEELRKTLGLHRRGAQSDAVLRNVVRRNRAALDLPEETPFQGQDEPELEVELEEPTVE